MLGGTKDIMSPPVQKLGGYDPLKLGPWSHHICFPKGFMYYRDHFISTILSFTESYLALSYVLL